jgi:hypothetical protein
LKGPPSIVQPAAMRLDNSAAVRKRHSIETVYLAFGHRSSAGNGSDSTVSPPGTRPTA